MNNKEERVQCQKLWAKNKYLVLSHSSKIYLEIRTYLKQEEVSIVKVSEFIKQAVSLPEDKGHYIMSGDILKNMRQKKKKIIFLK